MAYIPGVTGAAFRTGLGRDVRLTREDQAKKARELKKYMSRRQTLGKWGGRLGSLAMKAALGATLGPAGLMIAQAAGAGMGSLLGGSTLLSGKGPKMQPGVGTGLLGSTYKQLGEAKGGIGEAMRGQALGAGASQIAAGLAGAAGEQLGEAFGQTTAGVRLGELKSGYGKMLAEKGIKSGAQIPEGASGIFNRAGEFVPNQEVQSLAGSGLGRGFDYGDAGAKLFDPSSIFGQGYTPPELSAQFAGPLNPAQQRAKSLYESGVYADPDYTAQQGGYIPKYQMGGMMPGGVSNPLPYQEGGSTRMATRKEREEGMKHGFDKGVLPYFAMPGIDERISELIEDPSSIQEELATKHWDRWFDAKNTEDDSLRNVMLDYIDKYARVSPPQMTEQDAIDYIESRAEAGIGAKKLYKQSILDRIKGKQQGGYMPRYNIGGSVAQQPMAYQLGGLLKYRRSPFG